METLQPESIPVVPESPSLILRATHILLVRIVQADVGAWANGSDGMPRRSANLLLELEEVLKGDVDGHAGDRFRLEITQSGRPGSRVFALPGVWSDLPLDVGTRYVTFSSGEMHRAAEVLRSPQLLRVVPSGEALLDVRTALNAERQRLPLGRALEQVSEDDRAKLNHLFGEYVAARMASAVGGPPNDFDSVMRFTEDPRLSTICRTIIFEAAHTEIAGSNVPEPIVARFVRTAFRLLAMPETAAMHEQISTDMLPQVLGLEKREPSVTAEQVFAGAPAERQQAEQALAHAGDQQSVQRLVQWLRR